jgi:uncharacterized membrane protein (DUF441 family)
VFGLGTMVGMALITVAIAAPMAYASRRFTSLERYLRVGAGVLSVGAGVFLIYHIGFVDGLFTRDPMWTPR